VTVVIDASLVIRLLSNRRADELLRRRLAGRLTLHAPQLIDAEVASGVRGLLLGRKVESARGAEMLDDFASLPIRRHPMLPYQRRVIELRHNLTAYNAFYVALAESLGMPLITADAKLAMSSGHTADVQTYPPTATGPID
jgi:predicted nucleic acid-binding protein